MSLYEIEQLEEDYFQMSRALNLYEQDLQEMQIEATQRTDHLVNLLRQFVDSETASPSFYKKVDEIWENHHSLSHFYNQELEFIEEERIRQKRYFQEKSEELRLSNSKE